MLDATTLTTVDALRAELFSILRWTVAGIDMLLLFEALIRNEADQAP